MQEIKDSAYHCHLLEDEASRQSYQKALSYILPYFKECKGIVDLGCGNGTITELLAKAYPSKTVVGVDVNHELAVLARDSYPALTIIEEDALSFVFREHDKYDGYVMNDIVEHLDFDTNAKIFEAIPRGATLFIKTPNTDSVLGHQGYFQLPSHKTPYSRAVLGRLLRDAGYSIMAEGDNDCVYFGKSPWGIIRKKIIQLFFREIFLLLFGGVNYFVIAKKQ